MSSDQEEIIELQKQIQALENILRHYLSKEALTRYFTIKNTNPKFAMQILAFINEAVNKKYINQQLTDNEFKDLLQKIREPKKNFNIKK